MFTAEKFGIEILEKIDGWEFVLNGTVPLILCFVSNEYPTDDDTLDALREGLARRYSKVPA